MTLGATQFRVNNEPVVVTLPLGNRPKYYEWPPHADRPRSLWVHVTMGHVRSTFEGNTHKLRGAMHLSA